MQDQPAFKLCKLRHSAVVIHVVKTPTGRDFTVDIERVVHPSEKPFAGAGNLNKTYDVLTLEILLCLPRLPLVKTPFEKHVHWVLDAVVLGKVNLCVFEGDGWKVTM